MLEEGIIISSFISKIVNDLTDISIIKIKEAVKNRKDRKSTRLNSSH